MVRPHHLILIALALATPAAASERPVERECRMFVDQVAARIRAGDIDHARGAAARLRQCRTILKAALDRQAREIVEQHRALREKARRSPPAGEHI
jgi:hypothetical protein